ncbi:hypothetical protein INR49_025152 [Caranx melampygus]|nr:hypothetical protein INR49_025152 [Caranx melampygus]
MDYFFNVCLCSSVLHVLSLTVLILFMSSSRIFYNVQITGLHICPHKPESPHRVVLWTQGGSTVTLHLVWILLK